MEQQSQTLSKNDKIQKDIKVIYFIVHGRHLHCVVQRWRLQEYFFLTKNSLIAPKGCDQNKHLKKSSIQSEVTKF